MLFNSYIFIFVFLPATVAGFWCLSRAISGRAAVAWLTLCSLAFYGYWNPVYLALVLGSMTFNFTMGYRISRSAEGSRIRTVLTTIGVCGNLGLLGYFKYANFFVDSMRVAFGSEMRLEPIVLPLAISFFTFQQIAYLVDAHRGAAHEYNARDYALFVSFFPQLIAGPIVHHREMMPQFSQTGARKFSSVNMAGGVTIFAMGLFKKVLIADGVARFANVAFDGVAAGQTLGLLDSWIGTTAYTFQLYFDFSGYSDMAIGLALMFGIRLPMNFNSPYKSKNTAEFWRRWHITLGHFLRDYLYIPLGGSKRGVPRQYAALMITMALSGLWHGAGWTFVLWGFQQGLFHWVFRTWSLIKERTGFVMDNLGTRTLACAATFGSWWIGMVLFRADNLPVATEMYTAMLGFNGLAPLSAMDIDDALARLLACALIVWAMPNTQQIMARIRPVVNWDKVEAQFVAPPGPIRRLVWSPGMATALGTAVVALYTVLYISRHRSEFLYFQF